MAGDSLRSARSSLAATGDVLRITREKKNKAKKPLGTDTPRCRSSKESSGGGRALVVLAHGCSRTEGQRRDDGGVVVYFCFPPSALGASLSKWFSLVEIGAADVVPRREAIWLRRVSPGFLVPGISAAGRSPSASFLFCFGFFFLEAATTFCLRGRRVVRGPDDDVYVA